MQCSAVLVSLLSHVESNGVSQRRPQPQQWRRPLNIGGGGAQLPPPFPSVSDELALAVAIFAHSHRKDLALTHAGAGGPIAAGSGGRRPSRFAAFAGVVFQATDCDAQMDSAQT